MTAEHEYISLSIEKKIMQMIFPHLDANQFDEKREYYTDLAERGVGGFCVFNASIEQMRYVVSELNKHSDIPLLYACDMEFGLPMRFSDGTAFPRAGAIGKTGNPGNAFIQSKITALEAKSCGIFWNLAPVADVATNPDNPIIGTRAFSASPAEVAKYVLASVKASEEERVISCVKHFPGHGDTSKDSHVELPKLTKSLTEMSNSELLPFYLAIKQGVSSVMTGHLICPALDDSEMPASLSRKITTDFLRNKMNFDGIIITDALDMKSVDMKYPNGETAFRALTAGADVLLMPSSPNDAITYITNNLDKIDREAVLRSFDRIITQKRRCGILDGILKSLPENLNFSEHAEMALRMAKSVITLSDDEAEFKLDEEDSYLLVGVLTDDRHLDKALLFSKMLQSRTYNDCDTIFVNNKFGDSDAREILNATKEDNVVIFAVFRAPGAYSPLCNVSPELAEKLNTLAKGKKVILVNFASPDASGNLKYTLKADVSSDDNSSMTAVANLISGSEAPFDFVSDIDVKRYKPAAE